MTYVNSNPSFAMFRFYKFSVKVSIECFLFVLSFFDRNRIKQCPYIWTLIFGFFGKKILISSIILYIQNWTSLLKQFCFYSSTYQSKAFYLRWAIQLSWICIKSLPTKRDNSKFQILQIIKTLISMLSLNFLSNCTVLFFHQSLQ